MKNALKFLIMPVILLSTALSSCNSEPVITYTLDSDVVLKKIDNDIELVDMPNLPGKSIAHKNRDNADFNVLAFTDLHLDHYQITCNYTFSMLARNIMHANPTPDLVVFCGDNITSSLNEPRTIQFAELLESLGVYWCAVLGNHERNATNPKSIERDRMINIWCKYPHCLIDNTVKKTESGKQVWGNGNSLVNLVSNKGVTQSLYFLDSGTEMSKDQMEEYYKEIDEYKAMKKCSATETEFYDYIKESQITWYKETFTKIKNETSKKTNMMPHNSIFTHVPLYEQEDAYLKLFNVWEDKMGLTRQSYGGNDKIRAYTDYPQDDVKCKRVQDLYDDNEGYVKGKLTRRREDICYSPHDLRYKNSHTPIFAAMQSFGDNNALFCGHDHSNNYTVKWDGQFLCYVQAACYSSNNLFTKGLLGADPYKPEAGGKYDGHLIQGYSQLAYKNIANSNTFNVLYNIDQVENYYAWQKEKPDLYKRILDIGKDQYLKYKGKTYKDNHANYLDGK